MGCNPPCQNGAVCFGQNQCQCLRGYEGIRCEHDIDECLNFKPCDQLHGYCQNTPGGFLCHCQIGYKLKADGRGCIQNNLANIYPNVTFRGKSQKGIEIANQLVNYTLQNRPNISPNRIFVRSIYPLSNFDLNKIRLKKFYHPSIQHWTRNKSKRFIVKKSRRGDLLI